MKVAVGSSVGWFGNDSSVVSGKALIVQMWLSGLGSTPPTRFLARTSISCGPGVSPFTWYGVSQEPNGAPSSEHSKVAVGSSDVKVKVA